MNNPARYDSSNTNDHSGGPSGPFSLLSWNIHNISQSSSGRKTEDAEFNKILQQASLFCLQETKGNVVLDNYRCYNSLRDNTRSGGICIGIHRSLDHLIEHIPVECSDVQAIKISKNATKTGQNMIVINVYDPPENSSVSKKRQNADSVPILDQVIELIARQSDADILLVGDFNARTGNLNFNPRKENWEDGRQLNVEGKLRASMDPKVNSRGKKLLSMLSECNLSILNGNILGDVFGDLTCLTYNGASVVDYVITSGPVKAQVKSFKVLPMTTYSDHKPLLCSFKAHISLSHIQVLTSLFEDAPKRPKWDESMRLELLEAPKLFKTEIERIMLSTCSNSEDVHKLNVDVIKIIDNNLDPVKEKMGQLKSKNGKLKKKSLKSRPKHRWYDTECVNLKRALIKVTKAYGEQPLNQNKRNEFYTMKKLYRTTLKKKKDLYKSKLNEEILEEGHLTWSKVKELRSLCQKPAGLDLYDMKHFQKFFTNLYKKKKHHTTENHSTSNSNISSESDDILNGVISSEEISLAAKSLKNGKAAGLDKVLSEHLKVICADPKLVNILNKLFNACLQTGVYPWNTTTITPLLKKGDPYDPDNYRAIAVGSNIGKLFSTILLERLLKFRDKENPDTVNQLGFKKGAQTVDHIFTINTCIEKYVKKEGKRLYTAFVDFRKAFDSIPRASLLLRLKAIGVSGKFHQCLTHMYKNSKTRLKMAGKLSGEIAVETGTEQGHTLSPELFKIYVHSLSEQLNNVPTLTCPSLNGNRITHLLWADDLVLLALDKDSLQIMLRELESFCNEWGLEVNIQKTAVMIFSRSGKQLKESHTLIYKGSIVPSAKSYCYLGITLTLSGSFALTQSHLKQKGMRGYFALKKHVDLRHISKRAVFRLIDSLILPIVAYGCPVWITQTKAAKIFSSELIKNEEQSIKNLQNMASDPIERLHLSMLKWTLGVNKKTSNAAVWGDCGRTPLLTGALKQAMSYLNRLRLMDTTDPNSLVRQAFQEQISLGLPWFSLMSSIIGKHDPNKANEAHPNATLIAARAREQVIDEWNRARIGNRKLGFYNHVKEVFEVEPYIQTTNLQNSHFIARLRTSSHRFNRETGRYAKESPTRDLQKICETCCNKENVELLLQLPGAAELVLEDEIHVLRDCHRYEEIRSTLREPHKSYLNDNIPSLFKADALRGTSWLITRIFAERFGEKRGISTDKKKLQHRSG